jgi:CDP-4-dehydro-6-deoxyglucose reductase
MSSPTDTQAPQAAKPKGRQLLKTRVAEIRDYTPRIRELFIETVEPSEFIFRGGQFVMLHVPAEPKTLLRAYSMASGDKRKNGFRLIFNYVDGGPASIYVWSLKGGETLDFTGPFGRLFFKEPPTEQIVFLNTGSGVSQHFSYMESIIDKYPQLTYRLLFGVRTEQDIYYRAELESLKKHFKNFEYDYVLSRPSAEWKGKKGYVQNHIEPFKYLEIPTTFFMCGNGAMIKDVKAKLGEQGFDPTRILAEAFD